MHGMNGQVSFVPSAATRRPEIVARNRRNQSIPIYLHPSTIPFSNHCCGGNDGDSPSHAAKERFMTPDNFHKLGLRAQLVSVIERLGLQVPTEIQAKAIPPLLAGQNILATAETGSGKTAAFLLPIIERLERTGAARALVLAPTRELALQIEVNARDFSRAARLRTVAVVGGENLPRQIKARSMNTFQTTIDEVFKGSEHPPTTKPTTKKK